MSSNLFSNVPEIDFIDGVTLEDTRNQMIRDYLSKYKELTGEEGMLNDADPSKLVLNACALRIYQAFLYIDRSGKMDLLKYAMDGFVDNLGILKNVKRQDAKAAFTTLRFTLSEQRQETVSIPKGTRATGAMNLHYATKEYAEIPAGSLFVDVMAVCAVTGIVGNDYSPGQINTLVDISSCPYVKSVENITTTTGGCDKESDDHYKEKIVLAPAANSVAGPEDAYKALVKNYSADIGDVRVISPSPGCISIYFLLSNGDFPSEALISDLSDFISAKDKRPMNDKVLISIPVAFEYNLKLTYYINRSDANNALTIQAAVESAVNEFILWQKGIGKAINPDQLNRMILNAGAKRVVIESPVYTTIAKTSVASLGTKTIIYGGLEDD